MKRFCFLAVLMALSSSAYAGRSISFSVGGHRVHIESSRHCRSISCASMSISRRLNWRRKRDRYDDDRDMACAGEACATGAADDLAARTAGDHGAGQDHRCRAAAGRLHDGRIEKPDRRCAAAAAAAAGSRGFNSSAAGRHRSQNRSRPRSLRRRSSASRIRPRTSRRIRRSATGRPKARERCGSPNAAMRCAAIVLKASSNEKGEAILINMKPKTERQWTGSVYSQDSGETYYGTMSMKGDQHASRRSLRARPLLLLRQQLEPHHAPRRQPGDVAAGVQRRARGSRVRNALHPRITSCFARKRFGHENAR